tara:strand:+ start:9221 stop:9475 length:255 start_codon:yes stop_codon:yes gene_type:complete
MLDAFASAPLRGIGANQGVKRSPRDVGPGNGNTAGVEPLAKSFEKLQLIGATKSLSGDPIGDFRRFGGPWNFRMEIRIGHKWSR